MSDPVDPLLQAARSAAAHAYCPYSGFHVGAAVLCGDGTVVVGCNVENASYGLAVCAERTAIFAAIAQGRRPVKLAVTCLDVDASAADRHRMPCGACRQVIAEFLPDDGLVLIDGVGARTVAELLPDAFRF